MNKEKHIKKIFLFFLVFCSSVSLFCFSDDLEEKLNIDDISPEVVEAYEQKAEALSEKAEKMNFLRKRQAGIEYKQYQRGQGEKINTDKMQKAGYVDPWSKGQEERDGKKYNSEVQRQTENNTRKYQRGKGQRVTVSNLTETI